MARSSSRRFGERPDLSVPRGAAPRMGTHYDPDAFGRFSEGIARLSRHRAVPGRADRARDRLDHPQHHRDRQSLGPLPVHPAQPGLVHQAARRPLILLAQNRQDDRDRADIDRDRDVAARTQADTEFLARELAASGWPWPTS